MSALTSLLARDQVVPVRKIEEALQKQVVSGGEMSSVLLELDALPENTLAAYCGALYSLLPATRDEVMRVARDTVRLVPREVAERHRMVPLAVDARTLLVAMARPLEPEVEEQLGFLLGFELVTRIVCDVRISAALIHHYGIDAPPRHTRLIEKLRQREPGPVPYVAPPRDAKLEGGRLSALPSKRLSTADWLDSDDDDDGEDDDVLASSPPPSVIMRASQLPEGRPTDPMGFPRELVEQHAEASWTEGEPTAPATEPAPAPVPERSSTPERRATADRIAAPPRRPSSMPPPITVGVKSSSALRPQPTPSTPATTTAARPPSEPASETARALRRLRGPLTAAAGAKLLEQSGERDEILEVFFAFARQFFDYAALFVVHDDIADGRDAFGSGASVDAVRRMAIPLDVPGTFAEVRKTLQPFVGQLAGSELDATVLRDLGRDRRVLALVLPIAIRGRAVLMLYADRAGDAFVLHDVPELVAFVPRVVDAFEKLILRRKRGAGFHRAPDPTADSVERRALKSAAKSFALPPAGSTDKRMGWATNGGARRAPESATSEPSELPSTDDDEPVASASSAASMWDEPDVRAAAPIEPEPVARRARRASSSSLEAAGALAAEVVASSRPPSRKASMPALDVAALAREGAPRTRTLRSMLGIPREAPLPPEAQVSLPPVSEPPPRPVADAPVVLGSADPRDDDDEPELTVGSDDDDASDDLDDGPLSEPPVPLTQTRSEASRRSIPPAGGTYSLRDATVDVLGPRKRQSSAPSAFPAKSESPRGARIDPRAEDASDARVTREVVHVPAIDARRRDDDDSERSRPAPPSSEEMPSVIVDMGDHVNALVVDLTRCGPDDESTIVEALLRTGKVALPTLAQAFPGPPWFDRRRPYRRLPRGRDVSAIARALVAFRDRAVPYVESLLDAGTSDRRFYATLVAGELVHPGLVAALSARIFDDDDGTRAAALELLPRFKVFPSEWAESIALVRRAAKIRGRDAKKRHRAARALGAVRDAGALRLLVELLDDEDAELAETAHRALVEITCEDMGTAARRWAPWLQKNEKRHRVEWLIDALAHSDEAIRTAAGEELKVLSQQYYGYHPASPRKEREVVQQKYRRWWDDEGEKLFA